MKNFLDDMRTISKTYPGGVKKYVEKAKELILESTKNVNAFDGIKVEVLDTRTQ